MSHFFNESSSTAENATNNQKINKKKKGKSKPEYTIDNLPTDDKQKYTFISNYLKNNKNIPIEIVENLLKQENVPRNIKNTLIKIKNKKTKKKEEDQESTHDEVYDEKTEIVEKEDEDVVLDNKISEYMESGFKGIASLNQLIDFQKKKQPNNVALEKLLKAKLSLLNQHLSSSNYFEYKETLQYYLQICEELGKTTNTLFYIKMLMKTKYDEKDLIQFLSGIEDAKKIYFDFIFFSESQSQTNEGQLLDDNVENRNQIIDIEKLDEEYKLIYYIRNDFGKAIDYYNASECTFNQKILREFCLKSFQENELFLTKKIIKKIEKIDDQLENMAITLEIVGLLPLDIIKSKFVILEKNALLLKSINKKMELMRAYFLKINFDYEGCCNVIHDVMGIEVNEFLVPEAIC